MTTPSRSAALGSLMILQAVMLAALLFKLPPHPPETIPLGGMAPVLAASLSAAWAALALGARGAAGMGLTLLACLLAGLSYGPQKFFDPAISLVWPAVVTAQIAILALLADVAQQIMGRDVDPKAHQGNGQAA